MLNEKLDAVLRSVKSAIELGKHLSETQFNKVALELYELHGTHNESYSDYGIVDDWTKIPLLPISSFKAKEVQLQLDTELPYPGLVFKSSGTTQDVRSRHYMRDTEMYKSSILNSFPYLVLNEESLVPWINFRALSPKLENSSLYYMMEYLAESFHGVVDNTDLNTKVGVYDLAFDLLPMIAKDEELTVPVVLFATSLAYYDFVTTFGKIREAYPKGVTLPLGSKVIETGGWKGRQVDLTSAQLSLNLCEIFGLNSITREYSMSELSSQMYTELKRESLEYSVKNNTKETVEYFSMPWLRYRVIDPLTLEDVPAGESGVIAFYDLANVWSCPFILTEDQGRIGSKGGLILEGRVMGSDEKGCSLSYVESVHTRTF